jgi:mycoredoxin-dependent peroxiredoxin
MLAFGGYADQPRKPIRGAPAKRQLWISLLNSESRHFFASGALLRACLSYRRSFAPRRVSRRFVSNQGIGYDELLFGANDSPAIIEKSQGGTMPIAVGAAAPEFALKDQDQKDVKLSDFKGKKNVVIVFYPLDWSPVCTNEHICFVNDMKNFEKLDAQVLGLSVDSVWSHKAWAEKMGIHYPLLADFQPRGAVAEKFGVYLPEKGITGRAIAIIDRSGKVAWFKNYEILQVPDIKEVSDALAKIK